MYSYLKPSSHPPIDKQPREEFSFSEEKIDPPKISDID